MKKKLLGALMATTLIINNVSYVYANDEQTDIIQDIVSQDVVSQNEKISMAANDESNDDQSSFEIPDNNTTDDITDVNTLGKVILTLDNPVALVDGQQVELSSAPTVINNVTLLPLRFIGDNVVGAQTDWNQETKTVTITKGSTTVVVTVDSKIAQVNGMEQELLEPPKVINNRILLPLRFISESFGIPIDYDPVTKNITITKLDNNGGDIEPPIQNQAPIASFYFPDNYIAGQAVSVVDNSTDPDGDAIVERLWSVDGGSKRVTNKDLSKMFKTPRAGTYTIGLQVKDAKGTWSDWTYQDITIQPNEPPVITSLTTSKSQYAQGEKISLSYTYTNESWETVKEGKWTYRQEGQDPARATVGKPEAIFTPGTYIITCYLDDAYGNRSQGMETRVTITDQKLMSEFEYRFTKGKLGDWIDNFDNVSYLDYSLAKINNVAYDNGTLIMSDSPEMVTGNGILYRDSINGKGRILIHHINNITAADTQKLAVIIQNPTNQPVTVTLKNKVIKGPSTDILRVGQIALKEYLQGTADEVIKLAPGEKKIIYNQAWTYNACISGHIDVQTTGETKFIIAAMGQMDTIDNLDNMIYYPADGAHYSGTYDKLGIHYNVTLNGQEPERITLGIANSGEWAVGYDERTNTMVENTGNYGITYYVTVTAAEDTGVILNNRGGIFQGAIKWQGDGVYNMPGNGSFNGTTTKAVVMGTIKKGETKTFEYLLPNGSATPTLIGFIPASKW